MRNKNKTKQLGRTRAHRRADMANMASSLIKEKRIFTTIPKAKALRRFVEPLVTKSKTDTTHSRRVVFSYLRDKKAVRELFDAVAKKVAERPGGYTRILRTGFRESDNAEMGLIELVDYNENMLKKPKKKKKKRTRRSGSSKRGTRGRKKSSKRGSRGKGKKKKKKGKKDQQKKEAKKQDKKKDQKKDQKGGGKKQQSKSKKEDNKNQKQGGKKE